MSSELSAMSRWRVPDGWKIRPLRDVLRRVERPVDVRPGSVYPLMGVRWYCAGPHKHAEVAGEKLAIKVLTRVRGGDVTYNKMWARKGAFGVVPTELDQYLATTEYPVFEPDSRHVDTNYIQAYMSLRSFQHTAASFCKGSTSRARLHPRDFLRIRIAMPPLLEQAKIAAILSSVDAAIAVTQAVIEQTRRLETGFLTDLLTRGIAPNESSRIRSRETVIGRVPETWDVLRLGDVMVDGCRNGYSPVCSDVPSGRWILGLGALTFDGLDPTVVKPAPADDGKVVGYELQPGDFLVSRSNTKDRVGLAAIFRGEVARCSYPDLMIRFRANESLCHPEFLESVLRSHRVREFFQGAAAGTSGSMVKITGRILEGLLIPLPPLAEQRQIVDAMSALSRSIRQASVEHSRLKRTKAGLLQDLLTGRVRVTV